MVIVKTDSGKIKRFPGVVKRGSGYKASIQEFDPRGWESAFEDARTPAEKAFTPEEFLPVRLREGFLVLSD